MSLAEEVALVFGSNELDPLQLDGVFDFVLSELIVVLELPIR